MDCGCVEVSVCISVVQIKVYKTLVVWGKCMYIGCVEVCVWT